jgi:hypothetical protein
MQAALALFLPHLFRPGLATLTSILRLSSASSAWAQGRRPTLPHGVLGRRALQSGIAVHRSFNAHEIPRMCTSRVSCCRRLELRMIDEGAREPL